MDDFPPVAIVQPAETELYYLQSRYYNPEWGRFISADAFIATGQGILGNNMFAYCGNNPVMGYDPTGNYAKSGLLDPHKLLDIEHGGSGGGVIGIYLGQTLIETLDDIFEHFANLFQSKSEQIDWNSGNRNHILRGTEGKHIPGWRRFGIDPENNGESEWLLVLAILQETVDDADAFFSKAIDNGSVTYYFKIYIQEQVVVMVKIWENVEGTIQKISDAIPYMFG